MNLSSDWSEGGARESVGQNLGCRKTVTAKGGEGYLDLPNELLLS